MENKHKIEEYYFKKLKELYPELPNGKVTKPEPPDFVIDTGLEAIAIEITQIHNEKGPNDKFPPAQKHATEDSILDMAEHLFSLRCGIPLHVTFHFANSIVMNAKQREVLSEKICQLIEDEMKGRDFSKHLSFNLKANVPDEILYIGGYYFPNVSTGCWYSAKGRFVPNLTRREVLNVVERKEEKMVKYKNKVDKTMLVIAEGEIPNSWFDEIETFKQGDFVSHFDKVFIIRYLSNQLIELK